MLSPGQVLQERYRIDGVLGVGGMGGVYVAHHLLLDSDVAIKEVSLEQVPAAEREAALKLFRAEAQTFHRLQHANLPRCYEFFEFEGQPYLVMERVEGKRLDLLLLEKPCSEAQVMAWARQLCDVLAYLHGQSPPVIFRDLKPSNVIVTPQDVVKLIDFGISKTFERDAGTATMARGVGSRGFAPLEQYGGGTDARTDIYALGATLYNVVTQQVPPESTQLAVGAATLRDVRDFRPDLSARLARAIHEMMRLRIEERPASVHKVKELLEGQDAAQPVASPFRARRPLAPSPEPPSPEPPGGTNPPPWLAATGRSDSPVARPVVGGGVGSDRLPAAPSFPPAVSPGVATGPPITNPLPGPQFPPAVSWEAGFQGGSRPGPHGTPLHQQPTQALGGMGSGEASGWGASPPIAGGAIAGGVPDWRTLASPALPGTASAAPAGRRVPVTPLTVALGVVVLLALFRIGYGLVPASRQGEVASSARLVVTTKPAGARVKVDGKDCGLSPATVPNLRQGGMAVINIEMDGYETTGKGVRLEQAENAESFVLKALPWRANLALTPAATRVLVDGRPAARTAYVELSPGRHTVEFVHDGYHPEVRKVEAGDGRLENWAIQLKPMLSTVTLVGLGGTDVKVDGTSWGTAARRQRPLQVGRHELEALTPLGMRHSTLVVKNQPSTSVALDVALFVERQLMAQAPRSGDVLMIRSEGTREEAQNWRFTSADSSFSFHSYSATEVSIQTENQDGKNCRLSLSAPSGSSSFEVERLYRSSTVGRRNASLVLFGTAQVEGRRRGFYGGEDAFFTVHRGLVNERGALVFVEATFSVVERMGQSRRYGYVRCSRPAAGR